jgi:acyl-coenzyme A thioesterase PaaI-like protein
MLVNRSDLKQIINMEGMSCFGCGATNPAGLHMTFHTDEQRLYSFITTSPTMVGWGQTVHGGILTTMLDEIMGWSTIYLLGEIAVTKSITVEFKKPVQVGDALTVVCAIGEHAGRQVTMNGEIYCAEKGLCVRAEGVFASLHPQAAVKLGVMSSDYMERFLPVLRQREETPLQA